MKTKVYVIKKEPNETDQEVVNRTLEIAHVDKIITNSEKKILINPNWVCNDHFSTGNVTSTDTLEGIVSYLIETANIDPKKIIVADGGETKGTIRVIKLNKVRDLEEYGITVLDLNSDNRVKNVKSPNALALKTVNIAKTAMEASCIISVPSLKTHSMAETTLTMKNLMGTILPKGIMHSKLPQKIADLVSIFRDKMKFQVIDGIIGSDGFELGGSPVPMNLIIAGEDPVAVDTVGSAIIGYTPNEAKYLNYAQQKGLGTSNLEKIEIIGSQVSEVYRKF